MAETKKFTYRYSDEMAETIQRGIERFKIVSHSGNLSMNKFIDMCIERAINEHPARIKQFENVIAKKTLELDKVNANFIKMEKDLKHLKSLIIQRNSVEIEMNEFLKTN